MFHKHKWKEVIRTYAPPLELKSLKLETGDPSKFLLGMTTVLFKCEKCTEIRREEMFGKEAK